MKCIIKALLLMSLSIPAFAVLLEGHESGNGGQSIYQGNNSYLRDLVDGNNCLWHSATRIKKKFPLINDALKSISDAHWLTGMAFESQLNHLKFCFTDRRLPPLSYANSDDLYIFANNMFDQPAINDDGIVFIDRNIFEDMPEDHQAFLLLHEVGHEFFNKEELRSAREPRLRQFIRNLYEHFNDPYDLDTFMILMETTKFAYLRTEIGEYNRAEVERILSTAPNAINKVSLGLFHKYYRLNDCSVPFGTSKSFSCNSPSGIYGLTERLAEIYVTLEDLMNFGDNQVDLSRRLEGLYQIAQYTPDLLTLMGYQDELQRAEFLARIIELADHDDIPMISSAAAALFKDNGDHFISLVYGQKEWEWLDRSHELLPALIEYIHSDSSANPSALAKKYFYASSAMPVLKRIFPSMQIDIVDFASNNGHRDNEKTLESMRILASKNAFLFDPARFTELFEKLIHVRIGLQTGNIFNQSIYINDQSNTELVRAIYHQLPSGHIRQFQDTLKHSLEKQVTTWGYSPFGQVKRTASNVRKKLFKEICQ